MKEDENITQRIITSYKLMLDFYGMRLENEATGLISRSKNYEVQYRNLCSTFFCLDLVSQFEIRPCALRKPPRSRNLILSVRSESIFGRLHCPPSTTIDSLAYYSFFFFINRVLS